MIPPRKSTKSTEAKEVRNSAALLRSMRSLAAIPHLKSAMYHLQSSVARRRHEVEIQAPVLAVRPGLTFAGQPIRGLGAGIIFGLASLADSLGMKMIWGEATASSAPFYEKVLQSGPIQDLFIIHRGAMNGIVRHYMTSQQRRLARPNGIVQNP